MKYLPLIAILRGITTNKVLDIADILINNGFNIIEVPLNSPNPLKSIQLLVNKYTDKALIGAGTVLNVKEVKDVFDTGAKLIVSPNTNEDVIKETKKFKMVSIPGCFTASEALSALNSGADALKFFPASSLGPETFNAISQILPKNTKCFAVGGINSSNMKEWIDFNISGFGIGTNIYNPKMSLNEIKNRVEDFKKLINLNLASIELISKCLNLELKNRVLKINSRNNNLRSEITDTKRSIEKNKKYIIFLALGPGAKGLFMGAKHRFLSGRRCG